MSQMAAAFPEQAASAKSVVEKLETIGTYVSRASQEIDRVHIRLQDLEEMKNGMSVDIALSQSISVDIGVLVDLAGLYADKLHGQALEWLSPLDPSTKHEEIKFARVNGTCEWIYSDDDFQSWVKNPPSGHLASARCWIGDPGQGKTFTM